MSHKCVRCGKVYDGPITINSCECGARLFFFVRNNLSEEQKENGSSDSDDSKDKFARFHKYLADSDKKKIEKDIYEIIGDELRDDRIVFLDIEAINISGPGKYELDIEKISSGEALICKYADGKYIIDVAGAFRNASKGKDICDSIKDL